MVIKRIILETPQNYKLYTVTEKITITVWISFTVAIQQNEKYEIN
jgi:hypothetical protein